MNLFTFTLEKYITFKDIFPGLSRTLSFNFQDFSGPKWFSRTFQVLEFSRKNPRLFRTFQEAWEPCIPDRTKILHRQVIIQWDHLKICQIGYSHFHDFSGYKPDSKTWQPSNMWPLYSRNLQDRYKPHNSQLSRTAWVRQYQNVRPFWILLQQSGSGDNWNSEMCKKRYPAPCPNYQHINTPGFLLPRPDIVSGNCTVLYCPLREKIWQEKAAQNVQHAVKPVLWAFWSSQPEQASTCALHREICPS